MYWYEPMCFLGPGCRSSIRFEVAVERRLLVIPGQQSSLLAHGSINSSWIFVIFGFLEEEKEGLVSEQGALDQWRGMSSALKQHLHGKPSESVAFMRFVCSNKHSPGDLLEI